MKENNFKNMKKRPKLELEKILDILYKTKDDVFYFKEYGKDLISSFVQQEQDKNKYSEEEVEILLETLSKVLVYQGNDYRLPYYFEDEIKEVIKEIKNK
jgi:hypothetical protein